MRKFFIPESQASLFGLGKPKRSTVPRSATMPRPKSTKAQRAALPENQVKDQILGYLRMRRWIVTRQQVGTFVPYWVAVKMSKGEDVDIHANVVRIGEEGDTDWIARRPVHGRPEAVEFFYLEMKGRDKSPSPAQIKRIRDLKAIGFAAVWFDHFDAFRRWYESRFQD